MWKDLNCWEAGGFAQICQQNFTLWSKYLRFDFFLPILLLLYNFKEKLDWTSFQRLSGSLQLGASAASHPPPHILFPLPLTKPVHQGGGGTGGIHGLKEIIIDWCGTCCWFSWTAAPMRQPKGERVSHHWLSISFSSSWHIWNCLSLLSHLSHLSISGQAPSHPLHVVSAEHMPLTYTIHQSTRKGANKRWPYHSYNIE